MNKNNYIDSNFTKCYEKNLSKIMEAIRLYSGKHTINQEKADEFIKSQKSHIRQELAKNLIDNTIYITLQEIFDIVGELIDMVYLREDFNTENTIYLYTYTPEKSFYFLSVIALYHIRRKNYKEPVFIHNLNSSFFEKANKENSPIIILDDVSYSGSQLSNLLHRLYSDCVYKNRVGEPNIFVLLVALNEFSKCKLEYVTTELIKKSKPWYEFKKSPFKLVYLENRCYEPLILKLGIQKYVEMNYLFSPWNLIYLSPYVSIYLDHKMADSNSTYTTTLMYGQIPPIDLNDIEYLNAIKIDGVCLEKRLYSDIYEEENGIYKPNENITKLLDELDEKYKVDDSYYITLTKNIPVKKVNVKKIIEDFLEKDREQIQLSELKQSILLTNYDESRISFVPFINSCNENNILLQNINNREIRELDYFIFMIPEDCIDPKKDCIIPMDEPEEGLLSYLIQGDFVYKEEDNEHIVLTEKGREIVNIHNKITKYKCPISWYKKGELKIDCSVSDLLLGGGGDSGKKNMLGIGNRKTKGRKIFIRLLKEKTRKNKTFIKIHK